MIKMVKDGLLLVVSLKLAIVSHLLIQTGLQNGGAEWAVAYWQVNRVFACIGVAVVIIHNALSPFWKKNKKSAGQNRGQQKSSVE